MDKNLRDIVYFISFCIEQYKNEININEDEVISIFSEHNILDYLNEHYEVLHTQSRQWLIAEIDEIINKSIDDNHTMLKTPEINQDNLHLLLPSKISWLAGMLVE